MVYVGREHHRPGFVTKYLRVTVLLNLNTVPSSNRAVTVFVAAINWLDDHPFKDWFGAPVEVWQKHSMPHVRIHAFVPVTDIICRCAYVTAYAEIGLLSKIIFFDFSPASALIMSDPAV